MTTQKSGPQPKNSGSLVIDNQKYCEDHELFHDVSYNCPACEEEYAEEQKEMFAEVM